MLRRTTNRIGRETVRLAALAALTAAVVVLAGAAATRASQPFSPALNVTLAPADPGVHGAVTVATSIPAGHHPLDSVSIFVPGAWQVARGQDVPDGQQVGSVVMSADVGCNGSVENLPAEQLIDVAVNDSAKKAEWTTTGGSWTFNLVVDALQGGGHEIGGVLANATMPVPICAPQVVNITIQGRSTPGNYPVLTNPTSTGTYTWSAVYVSLGLGHLVEVQDTVAVCVCPSVPDPDGDGVIDETPCGGNNSNPNLRPERTDAAFPGDDDGDTLINEPLPAGSLNYDCDGDGWTGNDEKGIYGAANTAHDQDPCGNNGWPSDLVAGDNAMNIGDFQSFIAPSRSDGSFNKFGHPVPDPADPNIRRWDLAQPSNGVIDIADLNRINPGVVSSATRPPMFGGQTVFFTNGGRCPYPP